MKPKVRQDLAVADIDGETVVYDPEEDRPYHLNQSAAIAFKLCDGTGTADEIALDVAEVGGLALDQVLDQFNHMVHHFEELGLLEGSVPVWNREGATEQGQPGGTPQAYGHQHEAEHEREDEQPLAEEEPKDRDQLEEPEAQNH